MLMFVTVFSNLILQNEQKLRERDLEAEAEEDETEPAGKSTTPHMFCKTLTASDTSTHGGFSVPRRAAEDCFPPLDYSQQRPSQELIAKDLHSLEWKFRHIYWGQPRRHLLTTGWSAFVNKKKLVSGDAVLFLRGEDGELRLGIRRAAQVKGSATHPSLRIQHLNQSALMEIPKALSVGGVFNVYYDPRSTTSHFIIPYRKFFKSLDCSFTPGMRFKMRFEGEDASEQRLGGTIWMPFNATGFVHGKLSHAVQYLLQMALSCLALSGPDGFGAPDFGESYRFQKVLQGQENSGFDAAACNGMESQNRPLSELRRNLLGSNGSQAIGTAYNCIGFGESFRFHKVLQGQETFPRQSYGKSIYDNEVRADRRFGSFDTVQAVSSWNVWSGSSFMIGPNSHVGPQAIPAQASSLSSVLTFPNAMTNFKMLPCLHEVSKGLRVGNEGLKGDSLLWDRKLGIPDDCNHSRPLPPSHHKGNQDVAPFKRGCRLFGFSLIEGEKFSEKEADLGLPPLNPDASICSQLSTKEFVTSILYLLVGPRCFDDQGGLQRTLQRNALILHG
ncbi:hypothetical protein CDL15_Pgr002591 [Punica granatum]|uniref:Auxin response factor n=1 Tax=Punica granatum TaxID=22663 RepID=A0A218WW49_PUNGR|nr:hypothetical protein CDL15_Pgr002591 [Punica granatum]